MATCFREFEMMNQNGIAIQLTLEAPIGTTIKTTEIAPGGTFTFQPQLNDISSVRITVVAGGDHHTDIQTFERSGSPFQMFFETLKARTNIGSIHGVVSAAF